MRRITSLMLTFTLLAGQVHAEAFKAPDILVDSKLDFDWSGVLVSKVRRLLKNYGISDPFKQKINEPIVVSESLIEGYLNPQSKELVSELGNLVGLNILRAKTKVTLYGLSYDIKDFKTELKATEEHKDGLVIASDFSASQLNVSADKVRLSLVLPGKNNESVLDIDIVNPVVHANEERLINFYAKVKIKDNADSYKLLMENADFDRMAQNIAESPGAIDLRYDKIIVPEISLRVGNRNLDFSPAKIEKLLKERHEGIKGLLVAQFSSLLKKGLGTSILKVIEKYEIKKEYWLDANVLKSQIGISQFTSSFTRNNLEIKMPGDFCTSEKFLSLKKGCLKSKVTQVSKSRLSNNLHLSSVDHMKDLIEGGSANIVASISEDYVNKLLVTTYDAGLWKETLDEAGVMLGPNKIFMRMDERGDSGTLYMDVLYQPKKLERIAVGAKEVRFPLILKVALRIEKHDNTPTVIIRLNDVDLSESTLLNGRADLGLVSNINSLRFKKKIIKTITKEIGKFKNKDVIELRYPEIKGLGLDKVEFVSDGNGRMNVLMRLQDLIDEDYKE